MSDKFQTTDLTERVARAICAAAGTDPDQLWNVETPQPQWHLYTDEADAAIAIVKEAFNV